MPKEGDEVTAYLFMIGKTPKPRDISEFLTPEELADLDDTFLKNAKSGPIDL